MSEQKLLRVGNVVRDGFDAPRPVSSSACTPCVPGWLPGRCGCGQILRGGSHSMPPRCPCSTAACQRADGRAAHGISDCCDRSSITGRRSRKAGLDDIYLERFELLCNLDLLVQVHAAAGRLLTVAQRRVKNLNLFFPWYLVLSYSECLPGLQGQKKLRPLIQCIKRRSESSAVPLLLPQYGATPLCTSDNALPCNGGYPFPPTGPKDFQRTAPGRVSLLPDAALHQPAALCGQG